LRFLAKKGIVKIEKEYGRRVIAVSTEKGKEMIKEMDGRGVERSAQGGNVVAPDADAQKLRVLVEQALRTPK
jgi:DNA-binding MarR family transcriptional regulator